MPSSLSKTVIVNDLNSRVSKLNNEKQVEHKLIDKPANNLIESLASLNHKESDKIDPILSSASKKVAAPTPLAVSSSEKKDDCENKPHTGVSSASSNESNNSIQNSHVDHVPASSREFCMDLNFNLAAAAAATAAGPVVVVSAPDNRFTSNASTSSIHNDLKMILEECNEKTNRVIVDSSSQKKPNKSHLFQQNSQQLQQSPKPQRVQAYQTKPTSDKKTALESSVIDDFNLIKTMMSMENRNKFSETKHYLEQPIISLPLKENGRYRYSKV